MFSNIVFLIGGTIALIGALIHFVVAPAGASWYAFFGAPIEVIKLRQADSLLAPFLSIIIGMLMLACALYSYSAAGLFLRLPLTKIALLSMSFLCIARGLFPVIDYFFFPDMFTPTAFNIVSSLVWFVAGLSFFIGVATKWNSL
jgi:hypothetical protein